MDSRVRHRFLYELEALIILFCTSFELDVVVSNRSRASFMRIKSDKSFDIVKEAQKVSIHNGALWHFPFFTKRN